MKAASRWRKPHYGIDAPLAVWTFLGIAMACVLLGIFLPRWLLRTFPSIYVYPWLLWLSRNAFILTGACLVGSALLILYGSLVRKFRERDWLLGQLHFTGSEKVLDVGCGRGLMLLGAAKYLTSGKATGIDVWHKDQARGRPEATLANAALEGVSDRVEVLTMDAHSMTFEEGTFDVVLSSWALHNIPLASAREAALSEMVRVTSQGARLRFWIFSGLTSMKPI